MNLTDKILMIRPETFRSNEQTLNDNFFQKKISKNKNDNVLIKVINEFENLTEKLINNNIDVKILDGNKTIENP
jgi:hypothetical protein